jgi:hypothetical protein
MLIESWASSLTALAAVVWVGRALRREHVSK